MKNKSESVEIILAAMRDQKITKVRLGEVLGATGINQSKVQRANKFLNTKNNRIDIDDMLKVCDFLGLTPQKVLLKDATSKKLRGLSAQTTLNQGHVVPLIDYTLPEVNYTNQIREWLVYPYAPSAYKHIFAFIMPNESMEPTIPPGQILFVDKRIYSHEMQAATVLAKYQRNHLVGCFDRSQTGILKLQFENKAMKPLQISVDNDDFEILGVVVGALVKLNTTK